MALPRPATLLLAGLLVAAQNRAVPPAPAETAPATGLIAGIAVDASTKQGLPDTVVTLLVGPVGFTQTSSRVMTDPGGRFVFAGLPAGSYMILAAKPGYGVVGSAQKVVLANDERVTTTRLLLWKHAAVSGRVTDDLGDPVVGVRVEAQRRTYASGRPTLTPVNAAAATDDRGIYRISNLTPGDYVVLVGILQATVPLDVLTSAITGRAPPPRALFMATQELSLPGSTNTRRVGDLAVQTPIGGIYAPDATGPRSTAYQTTFAPSATSAASASLISLRSGEQRAGIDVQMKLSPAVTVTGTVTGPDGPAADTALRLSPVGGQVSDLYYPTASALTDSRGVFTLASVPAGEYFLYVLKPGADPAKPSPWAEQRLTVGDVPVEDVRISLRPSLRMSGRIEFEGSSTRATADDLTRRGSILAAEQQWSHTLARIAIRDDYSFTMEPLTAGRYLVRAINTLVSGPWMLKSAMAKGVDISAVPIDLDADLGDVVVTLTDHPTSVSGSVRDARGDASLATMVLFFPTDRAAWNDASDDSRRFQRTVTAPSGGYRLAPVPDGEYFVVAAVQDDATPGAAGGPADALGPGALASGWDPALLEQLARTGTRIRVVNGQAVTQDLTVVVIR